METNVKEALTAYAEIKTTYKRAACIHQLEPISSSEGAEKIFRAFYDPEKIELKEFFYVLYLNRANQPLACVRHSEGTIHATTVDVRELVQTALACNAVSVIVSHNHPSGKLEPSKPDQEMTQQIKAAFTTLKMQVLDHLIITTNNFYSFANNGLI